MPEYVAAGDHTYSDRKYRFMVMHQYGEDIEKKFTAAGRQFGMKTVCYLALRLVSELFAILVIENSFSFSLSIVQGFSVITSFQCLIIL